MNDRLSVGERADGRSVEGSEPITTHPIARSDGVQKAAGVGSRLSAALICATLFCLGAATTDLTAVPNADSLLLGVGLAVLGLIQLSASGMALARPTRRVLLVTGAVSLVGVGYWTISRTTGYLFGASMWMAEDRSFGSTDVAGALMRLVAAATDGAK